MKKTHYTVDLGMISTHKSIHLYTALFLLTITGSAYAQEVIKVPNSSPEKEVIVLPASYMIDKSFKDIDAIKSDRLSMNEAADFDTQLKAIVSEAAKKGGNVFQITRMEDARQENRFRFWGEVYHTNEPDKLKEKIAEKKKAQFNAGPCAYLTIYRPAYSQGFNDSINFEITINDTLKFRMQSNTRYQLKISKEGNIKIRIGDKSYEQNMNVDIKTGNSYYVRSSVNVPHSGKYINTGDVKMRMRGYTPFLETVDQQQGAIESSMVTQIVVTKKI